MLDARVTKAGLLQPAQAVRAGVVEPAGRLDQHVQAMSLLFVVFLHLVTYVWAFGSYVAPGPGDKRGPCPLLQTLANHGEINHDGTFNKDALINALDRNVGMCTGNGKVNFDALWIRDPLAAGQPGPPDNWEFDQSHMLTPWGGERDGDMAHTDRIFGDVTVFNATKWQVSLSFSSDGATMGLWDLYKAQQYWQHQSDLDNGRTDPKEIAYHNDVGVGNVALLWMMFGQKNISIPDVTSIMQGKFPDDYVRPAPWCRRDWIDTIFTLKTGGLVPVDDELTYLICKQSVVGIPTPDSYICELNWTPYVTALQGRSSDPPANATFGQNIPTDPGTRAKAFKMGGQFPYNEPDQNCQMDTATLTTARLNAVKSYFIATQQATSDYPAFEKRLSPLFEAANTSRIINNAAGIFQTVKIVVEYTALTIPALNDGFAWFGPPTVDNNSFKYFPNNATIITDNTQLAAFVCTILPIVSPLDGTIYSDGACESPLLRAAQTTMITFVPCSAIMRQFIVAFDDVTEKMAIYGFNYFRTCWFHDRYCLGRNRQYADFNACVTFMNSIPRLSCNWLLQGNSQQCRGLHAFLAKLDPDVHCPHIGPDSEPCSEKTCLADTDGALLCDDYPTNDIRYDSKKPAGCPVSKPPPDPGCPVCDGCSTGSLVGPNLLLALLAFARVLARIAL